MPSPESEIRPAARPDCRPTYGFSGQHAVVTGGRQGIGRAIADALGAAGAMVHVFDIAPPDDGVFAHRFVAANVADAASVADAMATLATHPTLLVNNAGITCDRSIGRMSDFDRSHE